MSFSFYEEKKLEIKRLVNQINDLQIYKKTIDEKITTLINELKQLDKITVDYINANFNIVGKYCIGEKIIEFSNELYKVNHSLFIKTDNNKDLEIKCNKELLLNNSKIFEKLFREKSNVDVYFKSDVLIDWLYYIYYNRDIFENCDNYEYIISNLQLMGVNINEMIINEVKKLLKNYLPIIGQSADCRFTREWNDENIKNRYKNLYLAVKKLNINLYLINII